MGKGGQSQTVTSVPDDATRQYTDYMRRVAMGYVGGGPTGAMGGLGPSGQAGSPFYTGKLGTVYGPGNAPGMGAPIVQALPQNIQDAIGQYGQYAQGGNLGFSALTGNAGAQAQFQNPWLSQMNPFFAQQRQQAIEGANQQATLAGAFGGDRSQIGAATAGNLADQTQAGFNYQAFNDAMQRALAASNLGFGAVGAGAFLPQLYQQGQLNLLGSAIGPYGQTTTEQLHRDPFSQLLGLGLTAGGYLLKGPAGAAGGGAGSLGG